MAFGRYNAIGYSPFFIERMVGPDTDLAAAYGVVSNMSPVILAHQGTDSIAAVRMGQGGSPQKINLGDYTLNLTFHGRGRIPIAPEPAPAAARPPQQGSPAPATQQKQEQNQGAAIIAASGPDEFFMCAVGGNFRIGFTPNKPGPAIAGLGDVQEGRFVDGKWVVLRQLGGDDTGQGEILTLRPNTVLRVTVYRYE